MRSAAHNTVDPYELLLDGGLGSDALSHVMAAVTAPGTQDELLGLPAARAAFLAAQAPTVAPARAAAHRRPAATRTVAGRLLAAKAVAAVSGITLVGGVAYAATTTSLFHNPTHHPPAQHSTQTGGTGGGSEHTTTAQLTGGNGPATAVPVRPHISKSAAPHRNAYGHTAGGPTRAHGSPHNSPNPGHQPGVGRSSSSPASGQAKTADPTKAHPAHPSQARGPHPHLTNSVRLG